MNQYCVCVIIKIVAPEKLCALFNASVYDFRHGTVSLRTNFGSQIRMIFQNSCRSPYSTLSLFNF